MAPMTCQKKRDFLSKKQTNKQNKKKKNQQNKNKKQKQKKKNPNKNKQTNKQTNFVHFWSSDFVHFRLSTLKSSAIHKITYCANSAWASGAVMVSDGSGTVEPIGLFEGKPELHIRN